MKPPFQRILLVTERTEFDLGAERVALGLARQLGLPLRAIMPVTENLGLQEASPELSRKSDLALADKINALKSEAAAYGVAIEIVVKTSGEPHKIVLREALDSGADLIIARKRGRRSFLSRLVIGEMISKIAAEMPCDLMLVPSQAVLWSRGILAVGDGRPSETIASTASALANAFRLPLAQLSVSMGGDPGNRHDKTLHQIFQAARSHGSDLIVMGQQTATKAGKTPFGRITQRVIEETTSPVLVIRQEQ
jgi:nucleotide-binding universal stress UspA family protein